MYRALYPFKHLHSSQLQISAKSFGVQVIKGGALPPKVQQTTVVIKGNRDQTIESTISEPNPLGKVVVIKATPVKDDSTSPVDMSSSTTTSTTTSTIPPTSIPSAPKQLYNSARWPIDADGKPMEPEAWECCGNDCHNCVWIQFDEQMDQWKAQQNQA